MIKKILYVGSEHEYSDVNKGESLNKQAFYNNFVKMGYDVTPVWYDTDRNDLQNKIMSQAYTIKPDMIFFILQKDQIKKETLLNLKNKNYFMVNFFGDDQWRFDDYSRYYANYFNVCLTVDKFSLDKYRSIGQENVLRSQWASLASNVRYTDIEYKYEISFVGGANAYRIWFINQLRNAGYNVVCFGDRWKNGRISYEEMGEVFSRSKINLNISNSVQYDMRYLISNPRNIINTLRSRKNVSQTKARIFEIPMRGGFELTEYVPSLEDYFNIGKEIGCYKDIDEAKLIINYYLNNDAERERIKCAGVQRARNEHSFLNRITEFMSDIENIKNA